jgi:hypothetical protein
VGPISRGFRPTQESKGSGTKIHRPRWVATSTTPPSQIHSYKHCQNQEGNRNTTRRSGEVLERNGHSTTGQAHPYSVRQSQTKGGECISAAPDRNGTPQWISPPDWSVRIRPMYMRTGKGNSQALSVPLRQMGCSTNQDAGTD